MNRRIPLFNQKQKTAAAQRTARRGGFCFLSESSPALKYPLPGASESSVIRVQAILIPDLMPLFLWLRHPVKIQGRGNVSCRGTKGSLISFRPAEKPRGAFPPAAGGHPGETPRIKTYEKSLAAGRSPEPSGSDSWGNAAEAGYLPFTNGKPAPSRRPCTAICRRYRRPAPAGALPEWRG